MLAATDSDTLHTTSWALIAGIGFASWNGCQIVKELRRANDIASQPSLTSMVDDAVLERLHMTPENLVQKDSELARRLQTDPLTPQDYIWLAAKRKVEEKVQSLPRENR